MTSKINQIIQNNKNSETIIQVSNSLLVRKRTAKTKARGELAYSKSPLYNQKGGGRARTRHRSNPIRVGGAKAHGPSNDDRSKKVNRKQCKVARSLMLQKHIDNKTLVEIDDIKLDHISTKDLLKILKIDTKYSVLLIHNHINHTNLLLSSRNLKNISIEHIDRIGLCQIKKTRVIIIEKSARKKMEEIYAI